MAVTTERLYLRQTKGYGLIVLEQMTHLVAIFLMQIMPQVNSIS